MAKRPTDDEEEKREIIASEMEETVHAEALLLFQDSAQSIFFAKAQQWKTVGSTLAVFLVIVALGKFISNDADFIRVLKLIVIVAGAAAIFIIGIYQFWQHTEAKKIAAIELEFSNVWREVRGIKSKMEANIHRYFLLLAMIGIIVIGVGVTLFALTKLAPFV